MTQNVYLLTPHKRGKQITKMHLHLALGGAGNIFNIAVSRGPPFLSEIVPPRKETFPISLEIEDAQIKGI